MKKVKDLIYKSTAKLNYGLPDSWFERIGKPDLKIPNPYREDGAEACLYSVERIEDFISKHWDEYFLLCQTSKKKSLEKGASETIKWAKTVKLNISAVPSLEQLTKEVSQFFNGKTGDFAASASSFIEYVRHKYSNYNDLVSEIAGKPGARHATDLLKGRVNDLIAKLLDKLNAQPRYELKRGLVVVC